MTKTEHYQLNQWDAADLIRREDFNADNAKLDAGLAALREAVSAEAAARETAVTVLETKSRFAKLWEVTLTAESGNIELDLSGVEWSKWDKVHLDCLTTNGQQMVGYFNSVTEENRNFYFPGASGYYRPRITFYPAFRADRYVCVTWMGNAVNCTYSYSSLEKMIINKGGANSTTSMSPGAKFILWGEA